MMKRLTAIVLSGLLLGLLAGCPPSDDGGGGGITTPIIPTRIISVSRAGAVADGGTDSVGTVSVLAAAPTLTYTITNSGTDVLTLTGSTPWVSIAASPAPVNITGTPTVTQPGGADVASGGGTRTFQVDYQVTANGAYSFTVVFGSDATSGQTGATFEINVSGTGDSNTRIVAVTRGGAIADNATDAIGTVGTGVAAATLTYTITNTGTGDLTLTGSSPWVTIAASPAPVNITGSPVVTQPAGATVTATGGTATFDVDYTVTAAGAFSFTITFGSNATSGQTGATFEINVSGTGATPTRIIAVTRGGAVADGATDAQGTVVANVAAPTLTYTITNSGNSDLTLAGSTPWVTVAAAPAPVNITGSPVITQPSGATVASGGGTVTFSVDYVVAGNGAFSFTVTFGSDATSGQTGGTFEIQISGTGQVFDRRLAARRGPTAIADGGTLNLGNRGVGVATYDVRIELENAGTDLLTLTGSTPWVTVAAAPAPVNITGSVTIAQPSGGTIAGAAADFFTFHFTVTAFGPFSFTLVVGSNATVGQTGATYEMNVSGRGHPSFSFEKAFPTSSFEPYSVGVDQGSTETRLVAGGFANGGTQFPIMEPSPNGAYLAYSYQPNTGGSDDRHLYVVAATGGTSVRVTPLAVTSPRQNISIAWGENGAGDQLLCVMSDHESSANDKKVYTCVISGTTPTINNFTEVTGWGSVGPNRKAFTAKWSADGTRLAFQLFINGTGIPLREVWGCAFAAGVPSTATNLQGSTAFTNTEVQVGGSANDYTWASNSVFVYAADGDAAFFNNIYAVSVIVGGGGTLVAGAQVKQSSNFGGTDSAGSYGTAWAVSPNGARLAYCRTGAGFDHAYVCLIDTSSAQTPVQLLAGITADVNGDISRLQWSPDSTKIAFSGDVEVDDEFQLYYGTLSSATGAVTVSGNSIRLSSIPAGYDVTEMHFSPDGGRILYEQNDSNNSLDQLVIATVSASPTRVTIASGFTNATANLIYFRWKPGSGDFIAINGDIDSATREIHVIPLGGPDLMTPGTRYKASGSFFTSQLSNYRWIP